MKNYILGIICGLGVGALFAGIISRNDDKMIEYERSEKEKYKDKYWEGNMQIGLYDDEVRNLKKIISAMTEKDQ